MVVSQLRPQRLGVFHEVGVTSGGVWGYKNVASVLTISVQTYVLATKCQAEKGCSIHLSASWTASSSATLFVASPISMEDS